MTTVMADKPESQTDGDIETLINRMVEAGCWDVPRLCAVYDELDMQGLLAVPRGTLPKLSESERFRVARLAHAGRTDEAIGFYIECALPDQEVTLELVHHPAYRQVCDAAVWTVWGTITHDYTPTPASEAFIRRRCGNRPVAIPLLDAAWAELKKRKASRERNAILDQVRPQSQPLPVTEAQIDSLDDSAVDRLYHDSLRAYAERVRHSPGVIA